MKLLTKIAPVALLSLLLLPTASQSMMGRALGGLAGGGLVVAGAYGVEKYGDRISSVFARGAQTAQEQIINQTATRTAEQIGEKTTDVLSKTTNLADTLLRQADRTLAVAERIVDSRLFPYVVAGGAGYFLYHKIKKYFAGTNATIKEESKTILEKLSDGIKDLKAWIYGDGMETRTQIAILQSVIEDRFGVMATEVAKLDSKTQNKLRLILENLEMLKVSQDQFSSIVQTNHKTIEKWINDLEIIRKKEFSEINARLNNIEKTQQEIVQGQARTENKVDQMMQNQEKMMQNLAKVVALLGVQDNTTIAQSN